MRYCSFFPHYIVFTDDENIAMPEMLGMLSIIYWVVKTLRMNATSCDERTSRAASTFAGLPQISTLGEASGGTYGLVRGHSVEILEFSATRILREIKFRE